MNRPKSIFSILLILIALYACRDTELRKKVASINGKIINPKGQVVKLSFQYGEVIDSLDSEGAFGLEVEIEKPEFVVFHHGNEVTNMYLRPGETLQMELNTDQFDETVVYSGTLAKANNFLASMVLLEDTLISVSTVLKMDENQFLKTLDSITDLKIGRLQKASFDDEYFVRNMKIGYQYTANMHKVYYTQNKDSVSDDYYSFQNQIDINDSSLLDVEAFTTYILVLFQVNVPKRYLSDTLNNQLPYFEYYLNMIDKEISSVPVKRDILFKWVDQYFMYFSDSLKLKSIDRWKSLSPGEFQLARIEDKLSKWRQLAAGSPAPPFRYPDINGDIVALEDFKGRNVYVDIWATWCAPCIAEQPALEGLQHELKNENIVFLSVSIDNDKHRWEEMVREKKLGGVQLYAREAWEATIVNDYLIEGIPRFMIIDVEGKIVSLDAGRPSGSAKDELKGLLKRSPNI